ncbi:alkyl sulfatase [Algimonas arctica]|uniref:Alkyl sulfatase n=1 Tax=Algimonas arctica TaxID=1479486 RepID=A0A8J3CQK0_9PROT|nr:alkyl sulfatase dimerization domain-containing protein [Algimonas arctica]GHA91943.1 alkyl sulfatase [Algimonas arctica]
MPLNKTTLFAALLLASPAIAQDISPFATDKYAAAEAQLDFTDTRDFDRAKRGYLGTLDSLPIAGRDGSPIPAFDPESFDFLKQDRPDTVHPALWRQSQLNAMHGLFEVTDGIYQVRGFDLSNISIIRGDTGWIVVDPLITRETAAAAMKLVNETLGERPVSAVIFTHSHVDHYGGVRGVLPEGADVPIIAPANFVIESVSENVLAGNAMSRRASYMFGGLLPKGPTMMVGAGLGPGISTGTPGIIAPTLDITKEFETHIVDGVEIEFMLTQGAEAPSEFMFYLPKARAFMQAEIINHTLHNLYTPRGAKVRDGRLWSTYIDTAIQRYADQTDVSFGSHHWPVWGGEDVRELWSGQRDLYRVIHDQTVRLANMGHTINEIPDLIQMPDRVASSFANRDYYGTVSHNSRAQYNLYFGFFDGNPANLDPLTPAQEGQQFVDYAGGADAVIDRATKDVNSGNLKYAATALNHLVFSDPKNQVAADALADVYTQMAYAGESGPWRNFYLTGAQELRGGIAPLPVPTSANADTIRSVPLSMIFDLMAVRLNPDEAEDGRAINMILTDTDETAYLFVSGGALHHRMGVRYDDAPTLTIARADFDRILLKDTSMGKLLLTRKAKISGNPLKIRAFFGQIEEPPFWFEIIRP